MVDYRNSATKSTINLIVYVLIHSQV